MIELRKLKLTDKKFIAELLNNKNVWNNLTDRIPFPYKESDAEEFIKLIERSRLNIAFAIIYNEKFVGTIGLIKQKDVRRKSAELGYWIGEPFWNKGIATQAVQLITEYGFNKLDIFRIFASVYEYNVASMKVLKKNGFVKEGILRKSVFKNNKLCDEHIYGKLKDSL